MARLIEESCSISSPSAGGGFNVALDHLRALEHLRRETGVCTRIAAMRRRPVVAFRLEVPMSRALSVLFALAPLSLVSCGEKVDTALEHEGDDAGECSDDADNDRDGLFDCDDPDCAGASSCSEGDTATDSDSDSDTDSDADTDADTDADADADTDAACEDAEPCLGDYDVENGGDLEEVFLCESVTGYLLLEEQDWLTSLDLPCLENLGYHLSIYDNDSLTSLDLHSLATAGGGMDIRSNDALSSLEGLSGLATVDDDLSIYDNDSLTSLEGLSSLTTVGRGLLIYDNASLTTLEGLSSFTTVDDLSILYNDSLTSLEGLSGVKTVGDDLSIYDNASLCQSDAEAFAASIEVGGTVDVRDNGSARTDCP